MQPLHEFPPLGATPSSAFPSPQHNSSTVSSASNNAAITSTVVQTRMRKSCVSFTAHFVGLSCFPSSPGVFTSSSPVDLEDKQWSVRLYPGGKEKATAGYISCGIVLESRGTTRASYRISVINQMGWKNHVVNSDTVKTFTNLNGEEQDAECCEHRFISRDAVKNAASGHCVDDTVIIQVELTVFGEVERSVLSTNVKGSILDRRGRSLTEELSELLFEENMSDLKIYVQEEVILAHKFILCLRSTVFKAMLCGPMTEGIRGEIIIEDASPLVIKEMLRFMYLDYCDPEVLLHHAEELLAVACKYDLERLQHICENHLCINLNKHNVAGVLHLADLYGASLLKKRALVFISQNTKEVVSSESFFSSLNHALCQEVIKALAGMEIEDSNSL